MMRIICTLNYISQNCNNWFKFCDRFGWDEYAPQSGGHIEQELTLDEAKEFGLID